MRAAFLSWIATFWALFACGCMELPLVVQNPLILPGDDFEYAWQQTVEVVDEYFDISSENRADGRIETYPQSAATLLEPWRPDSVDRQERLEATLQSIRRRAYVQVKPSEGGYAVHVEVHKELEDLPHPVHATTGEALFHNQVTVDRERQVVGPFPATLGWIHIGRDWKLESQILFDLQCRFGIQLSGG